MATRTRVAQFLAEQLAEGQDRQATVQRAAAWLVTQNRGRQASYLARDAAAALAGQHAYLYARVTTARPLSDTSRQQIETYLREQTGARELELDERVDPQLIGGVQLDLPDTRLDASVRRQLTAFIEGAAQ